MNGWGILRGMAETMRNFAGSYRDPARLATIQYPEVRLPAVENARTIPFLVFDDNPATGLRCTACTICEQECPAQCIYIVKDTAKKPDYLGKMQLQPRVFDIDISVCMGCGICAEVCPFDSIQMDQVFELSASERFSSLLLHKAQLAKPNEHFRQIHPEEAAATDQRREAEKQKAEAKKAQAAAAAKTAAPVSEGPR
ncbi:MAG TPA: 4Fe-4S dicluster domain-containing protein [Verrucomicrobiae bacterium]|jgi:NADH-quinone oxidoreductase subunit I|nr:4Fe-4S dicluster domain-containing protein [Verrucomicrobiae bacterium]